MEEKETAKLENNEIIFFLGAGASVAAEVPPVIKFADDFEKDIKKKKGILEKIKKKYGEINVESLLKAVYSSNSENESALDSSELKLLKKELEQFVHEKLTAETSVRVGDSITKELINEFEENIRKKAEALEEIQKILREKREKVDIELLLEALHELNNRSKYVLPDISELNEKLKGREYELKSLEKELRQFIREKTIVSEDKICYLAPLKELVKYKTLDIFSVNYDTCIEQFCKKHNLTYTDGFDSKWDPELFKNDYKIKLYKLHGSVTWYRTDEGDYIKVPIAEKEAEIELITGEKAKTLMVYPMPGKFEEYSTPRSESIPILHKKLEKAKVCIVIGYRFRDEDIRTIFFEAAKKASQRNEGLTLYLISPHAGKIYDDKLKFIDKDKKIPSSLEGRVICWNYPMENVLKDLHQSLGTLASIQILSPEECVSKCIEIGYTSKAEDILEKELGITLDNLKESPLFVDEHNDKLRVYCGLGVNHLYSGHYDKAKRYFKELKSVLEQSLEVGNEYFDLHRQSTILNESQDEERKEINSKLKGIEDKYRRLLFYKWFTPPPELNWNRRLQRDFIDLLNKELERRYTTKKDSIDDIFSEIIKKCEDMVRCLEMPYREGIYKDSAIISIYSSSPDVEIARKEEAEKKLKEILKAFGELIDFCEEKE